MKTIIVSISFPTSSPLNFRSRNNAKSSRNLIVIPASSSLAAKKTYSLPRTSRLANLSMAKNAL